MSQRPVRPQVMDASAAQPGSGRPGGVRRQRPTDPVWLQDRQGPVQATLQQTPSVQCPDEHWSSVLHTAPVDFFPQLPFTHSCPAAQWVVHDSSHLLVAGSHENGKQASACPGTQAPLPSQTRPAETLSPSQVPGWQVVSFTHWRQPPFPSQVPSGPQVDSALLEHSAGSVGLPPAGTFVH